MSLTRNTHSRDGPSGFRRRPHVGLRSAAPLKRALRCLGHERAIVETEALQTRIKWASPMLSKGALTVYPLST